MSDTNSRTWLDICFPARRFDEDFPLALWFAGLWFYLKSFLYLCYLYTLGLEPPPYAPWTRMEIGYFLAAFLPVFILGMALWNEKRWAIIPSVIFLLIDTPVLIVHVGYLAKAGFLESGLTRVLEYGALGLNIMALGWLIGYRMFSGLQTGKK